MKLQSSLVYTILASENIILLAAAKNIRGSATSIDVDVVDESQASEAIQNVNSDIGERDLYIKRRTPYRIFAEEVEPQIDSERQRDDQHQQSNHQSDGHKFPQDLLNYYQDENDMDVNRIIGGNEAQQGRYGYHVSLQDYIGHFCGGTLISRDVVLTAAHCAGGSYEVVINRHDLDQSGSGQVIKMKREIKSPKYNAYTTDSDFNLVLLEEPVDMTGLRLVTLNSDKNYPPVGQRVTVMGYGDTNISLSQSDLSSKLMEVEVRVISNNECDASSGTIGGYTDNYNDQITDNMICAKEDDQDACQGDSGGPLIVANGNEDKQVGVVSWGIGCASQHFPGVYARVSEAYDWIKEEVCRNSDYPAASFNCNNNNGNGNGNNPPPAPPPASDDDDDDDDWWNNNSGDNNAGQWTRLWSEDFTDGLGRFKDGGSNARHYNEAKYRRGVVRVQQGKKGNSLAASVFLKKPIDVKKYDTCKVSVNFYMIGMEDDDKWCVEYCSKGNNGCNDAHCFSPKDGYRNKVWYDNKPAEFSVKKMNKVWLRLGSKSDSRKDDALISDVLLECQ